MVLSVDVRLVCMCHLLEAAIMATFAMGYAEHSRDVDGCTDG